MTAVKLVNTKGKPPSTRALAEEMISRQSVEDALRAAQYAYDRRVDALRAEGAALQAEYLAEVARIIAEE